MSAEKSSSPDCRARNWTALVYPDSAPENWRDILDNACVPWVESPLHCYDVEETGELKKAHTHIQICFSGMKSYSQVKNLIEPLHGSIPKIVNDSRSLTRYFCHLDQPSKYQYPLSELVGHCGFDVSEYLKPTSSQRYAYIREMCSFVRSSGIKEFQDIMDYAIENHPDTWFPALCDNSAYVVGLYIKSQRHRS